MKQNKDKQMIVLGNTRIRLSNIKNYGIASSQYPYQKLYTRTKRSKCSNMLGVVVTLVSLAVGSEPFFLGEHKYSWDGDIAPAAEDWRNYRLHYRDENGVVREYKDTVYTKEDDIIMKKIKYLYITTYQNDNFVFREDISSFSIYEKCQEIDEYFNS